MQFFFKLSKDLASYVEEGKEYNFPNPEIMSCHTCTKTVQFQKHGFYERYLETIGYKGLIVSRRYICPNCGCTISYLPNICISRFIFSPKIIFAVLYQYFRIIETISQEVSRQLLYHYRRRLRDNLKMICAILRDIIPNATLPPEELDPYTKERMVLDLIKSSGIYINDLTHRFQKISKIAILSKKTTTLF